MTKEFYIELISNEGTAPVLNDRACEPIYFDEVTEAVKYGRALIEVQDYPNIVSARVIDIERKRAVSSVTFGSISLYR